MRLPGLIEDLVSRLNATLGQEETHLLSRLTGDKEGFQGKVATLTQEIKVRRADGHGKRHNKGG